MLIQGHFGTTSPVKWPIQLHHETPNHHSRRIEWVNRYFLNHYRLKMQWNSKNVHFRANMLVQGRVGAQIFIIDHFWLHHRIPHPQIALKPAQPEKNCTTSHFSSFLKYVSDSIPRFVCPLVGRSVGPHFTFFMFLRSLASLLLAKCFSNSNTAPAHPHATKVAVYPALF